MRMSTSHKWENSHFQNRKENVLEWVNNSVLTCFCYSLTSQFRRTYCENSKRVSLFINYERDQEKTCSAQLTSRFWDTRYRFPFCIFSLHAIQILRFRPLFLISPVMLSNHLISSREQDRKSTSSWLHSSWKGQQHVNVKGIAFNQREDRNIYTYSHLYTTIYNLYTKAIIQIFIDRSIERG